MTPEQRALRDAFLAECWKPCPELPRHERDEKRRQDRVQQRAMEEMTVPVDPPIARAG